LAFKNIEWVNEFDLCHGCGACSAVCPCNAITMVNSGKNNFPSINENCTNCSLCNNVCSGQNITIDIDNSPFFKIIESNEGTYLAHSNNINVRETGASGGFITQYLLDLLETGKINGAVVATSDGTLKGTKAIIAESKDEIIKSASSKYYPISNCEVLKFINPNKKYAFVGKGCDIASLNMIQKNIKKFEKCIYIKIGIMCAHTPYANASADMLRKYGFNLPNEAMIVYRDKGWPGQTLMKNKTKSVSLDYIESWCKNLAKPEYTPYRCHFCIDSFAEGADIVVGDPWIFNLGLENKSEGLSLVLAYTQKGKEEIEQLFSSKNINVQKSVSQIVLDSQTNLIHKYKRAYLLLFFGKHLNILKHALIKVSSFNILKFMIKQNTKPKTLLGVIKFLLMPR